MNAKILEFSASNYRSFKDINTLSLVAANLKSQDKSLDINNVFEVSKDIKLLTSAVIYGANASGKSNFISAMTLFKKMAVNSTNITKPGEGIKYSNFKLSTETEDAPSFFQIIFFLDGMRYRYGFEINRERIVSEWLYYVPTEKEAYLFLRDMDGIKLSRSFKEGRGVEEKTRENATFLSVVANFNGGISNKIMTWFKGFQIISGLDDNTYKGFTIKNFNSGTYHNEIVNLLKKLDLGIEDIKTKKLNENEFTYSIPENMPDSLRAKILGEIEIERTLINTAHKKFDENGNEVENIYFNLQRNESNGTQKLFYLSAPLIDTLKNGNILVIDEVEARLHPIITRSLIQLFNCKESNPNDAQLIITTHDTNLLSKKIFRRDQIWFIEKDQKGASHLFSLAELKVRNFDSFENDYIKGRYGAIPFLSDASSLECD